MKRIMQQIEVSVNDQGFVCLSQDDNVSEDSTIWIHPDQIELVVKWLRDVECELKSNQV